MNYPNSVRTAVRNLATLSEARHVMLLAVALAPVTGIPALSAQETPAPASATAPAADSNATGSVTGRVVNGESGKYLSKATVTVKGTNQQVLTDESGYYTLLALPAGLVTLEVGYTGQETLSIPVTVAANDITVQDFSFGRRRSDDGAVLLDEFQVQTDKIKNAREMAINEERFSVNIKNVVSTDQFGNIPNGNVGELVKFMPGIQVDYGSSNGNNQGYSDSDANGVSVRGFGPDDTAVLIDGLPVSSTVPGSLTRQVGLDQLSINNADRVELIKVATPDMPANSQGGQINLVTKSAFDYAKPTYSARIFFNFNSLNTDLGKTVGPTNKSTYKTTPGLDFTVTHPFSSKFGVSFTGFYATEYSQTYAAQPIWNNSGGTLQQTTDYADGVYRATVSGVTRLLPLVNSAGQASSLSNPVLTRYQITDSGRLTDKTSGNFKVDWKPTPNQTLRANVQYSTADSVEAQRRLDFRPVLFLTNTFTGPTADWNSTSVTGITSNGTTAMTVTTRDRSGDTLTGQLQYNLSFAGWKLAAAGSISKSQSDFEDEANGHFSEVNFNLNPGRVSFYDIKDGTVGGVLTYTRTTNLPLDYTDFSKWAFDGTTAKSGETHNETTISLGKLDVERDLSFLPFLGSNSLSIKVGARRDIDELVKSGRGTGFQQVLRPGASYVIADVLDTSYVGQSPGFGLAPQTWGSTYKLFEVNEERDIFWVPDYDEASNSRVNNYVSAINQLKSVKETKDAWYAQLTGRFFKNRLSFVGGLRQESAERHGYGPFTDSKWNYIKRPDGTLYTDAANLNGVLFDIGDGVIFNPGNSAGSYVLTTGTSNRPLYAGTVFGRSTLTPAQIAAGNTLRANLTAAGIAYPSIPYGAPGSSLASRMLQLSTREIDAESKGDPSFSFSTQYKLTKKIDLKAAWSRSFGLPDLENGEFGILSGNGNFVINDFTATEEGSNAGFLGEIKLANPNQPPSISTNYDFEAAYYTDTGGKLSASYFYKIVTNQPISVTTLSGTPTFNEVLPVLGLDPADYTNWRLVTATTADADQITQGVEMEVRQDFAFLGGWGKNFQGFLSYSFNILGDPPTVVPYVITNPNGTTTTITPAQSTILKRADKFGGAGLQFSGRRFSAQIRGTYKNENEEAVAFTINGNAVRLVQPAETRIDINLGYQISKRYSLFFSGKDVFNGERFKELHDDSGLLATYAQRRDYREFGTVWTAGVNANF